MPQISSKDLVFQESPVTPMVQPVHIDDDGGWTNWIKETKCSVSIIFTVSYKLSCTKVIRFQKLALS